MRSDHHRDETRRLEALRKLGLLETPCEERFDRLTRIARAALDTMIAAVCLVDSDRLHFKSIEGLARRDAPRRDAFCSHAILGDGLFEVGDAVRDVRFFDHPWVAGYPNLRFYAGYPVHSRSGYAIGTVFVADPAPRILSDAERRLLREIARMVSEEFEVGDRARTRRNADAMAETAVPPPISTTSTEPPPRADANGRFDKPLKSPFEATAEMFENAPTAMAWRRLDGRYVAANSAWRAFMGCGDSEVVDINHRDLVPEDSARQEVLRLAELERTGTCGPYETELITRNRGRVPAVVKGMLLSGPDIASCVWISVEDLSEHKQLEEKFEYQAKHDALTGLPNRAMFHDRLVEAIEERRRKADHLAVMFVDLDGFKMVNDTLGHNIGDLLLMCVTERLRMCVRARDLVARLGGDEFALMLPGLHTAENAVVVAEKIKNVLNDTFIVDQHELHVTSSIGISVCPRDGDDVDTLLANADAAMYLAKNEGKNDYRFFTKAIKAAIVERHNLKNALFKALQRRELTVMYQPQVDLETEQVVGVEALVRWDHPERGMLDAGEFIPLAEETGLNIPIMEYVLEAVCEDAERWQELGVADARVSVNVSPKRLRRTQFIQILRACLETTTFDQSRLQIEFNERVLNQEISELEPIVHELKSMGIGVAVDGFGTGYASLGYLRALAVDTLKIDRSFIQAVGEDFESVDCSIVQTIVSLARDLRKEVVAGGVETARQAAFLRECGCNTAQGYYFGKPMPADEAGGFLTAQAALSRRRVVGG